MEEKIVENKKEDLPSRDLFHSLISITSLIYRSIYLVCLRSTTPLWFTDIHQYLFLSTGTCSILGRVYVLVDMLRLKYW